MRDKYVLLVGEFSHKEQIDLINNLMPISTLCGERLKVPFRIDPHYNLKKQVELLTGEKMILLSPNSDFVGHIYDFPELEKETEEKTEKTARRFQEVNRIPSTMLSFVDKHNEKIKMNNNSSISYESRQKIFDVLINDKDFLTSSISSSIKNNVHNYELGSPSFILIDNIKDETTLKILVEFFEKKVEEEEVLPSDDLLFIIDKKYSFLKEKIEKLIPDTKLISVSSVKEDMTLIEKSFTEVVSKILK